MMRYFKVFTLYIDEYYFETVPQLVFCRCTEPLPIFTSFCIFFFFNQQQAKTNLFAQSCYNNNRMATSMKLGNIYGLMTELNFIFVREQLQVAALFN